MAETMDGYGHVFPDDEDLGRGAIEAMIKPVYRTSGGTAAANDA
jgi:hypothetical protein